jgi:hypothetical protein
MNENLEQSNLPWYMKSVRFVIWEGFCILSNGPLPLSMHARYGRLRMRPWASAVSPALSHRKPLSRRETALRLKVSSEITRQNVLASAE